MTFKLQISVDAFNEVAKKLQMVLRDEAIIFEADGTVTLDMAGIALVCESATPVEAIRKGLE